MIIVYLLLDFFSSKPIGFIVPYDWLFDALLIVFTMHQYVFDLPFLLTFY